MIYIFQDISQRKRFPYAEIIMNSRTKALFSMFVTITALITRYTPFDAQRKIPERENRRKSKDVEGISFFQERLVFVPRPFDFSCPPVGSCTRGVVFAP